MKNVLTLSAKRVLIPLELSTAAANTDIAIQRKIFGSGITTSIISNKDMDNTKNVKSFEELGLSIKSVSETIKNNVNKKKMDFVVQY